MKSVTDGTFRKNWSLLLRADVKDRDEEPLKPVLRSAGYPNLQETYEKTGHECWWCHSMERTCQC